MYANLVSIVGHGLLNLTCFVQTVCFCGSAFWASHTVGSVRLLKCCYDKYLESFFGYAKYYRLTDLQCFSYAARSWFALFPDLTA
jgi:hypothetical protein